MRRWLLFIALFLVVLIGATWWFLPTLIEMAASRYAPASGVRDLDLHLTTIGPDSAHASRVGFVFDTPEGPMQIQLKNVTVSYDINTLEVRSVQAASGLIRWHYQTTAAGAGAPTVIPVLPTAKLAIDELRIVMEAPGGTLRVNGALQASTDPVQGVHAELHGKQETIVAHLSANGAVLSMEVSNFRKIVMIKSKVSDPLGDATQIKLDVNLNALHRWLLAHLQTSAAVRAWIQDTSISESRLELHADYSADTQNWTIKDAHASWQTLRVAHVPTFADLRFTATPSKEGWVVRFTEDSTLRIEGGDLPIDQAKFSIGAETTINLGTTESATSVSGSGRVQWQVKAEATNVSGRIDKWSWRSDGAMQLDARDLNIEPGIAQVERLSADAKGSKQGTQIDGTLALSGLVLPKPKRTRLDVALEGRWSVQGDLITARGDGKLNQTPVADWKINSNINKGTGEAKLQLEMSVALLQEPLSQLNKSKMTVLLKQGRLLADANMAWREQGISGKAKAKLVDLDLDIAEAELTGVRASVQVDDLLQPKYVFDLTVPQAQSANEMKISDLYVNGSWQGDVIQIDTARLNTLQGEIQLRPGRIELGRENTLVAEAKNLELATLFNLVDVQGLSGSGRLSGTLPVLIYPGGFEVADSALVSDGPGTLRYITGDGNTGQLDNIALQALSDFRHDAMNVKVAYKRNGDYLVQARLKGHNPNLYNGYPIAFNVNLQGNLPGMLRASLITGDFDKEVLKQVQTETKALPADKLADPKAKSGEPEINLPKNQSPEVQ